MNLVIVTGNLVKDPECGTTSTGKMFAKFDLAINEFYQDKEKTIYIKVSAWGKLAEFVNSYTFKGDNVAIKGKLNTFDYELKDGTRKSGIEILADTIEKSKNKTKENKEENRYEDVFKKEKTNEEKPLYSEKDMDIPF